MGRRLRNSTIEKNNDTTNRDMIERYQGESGRRLLIDALEAQQIVNGDRALAGLLAERADLIMLSPGDEGARFIKQGDPDNMLYLIVSGKVSILVNGREVNTRKAGQHVGEMTVIDPKARRSACVVVTEQTVLAKFLEATFADLATTYPDLWRRLARELGERLRQRGELVPPKNQISKIFIGSSSEALPVARAIQSCFAHDDLEVTLWTDGVFRASSTVIDDLLRHSAGSDFAILVLTPDDKATCRKAEMDAPRDNCVFELGMFIGVLGRNRTFIVKPRGGDIKIPTDVLGITPLEYTPASGNRGLDLGPICNEIRQRVAELGTK
jgi:predicted nucleotide-binding protein